MNVLLIYIYNTYSGILIRVPLSFPFTTAAIQNEYRLPDNH